MANQQPAGNNRSAVALVQVLNFVLAVLWAVLQKWDLFICCWTVMFADHN